MKKRDINVKIEDYLLNVRAVAVIKSDNKILFQKRKQDKFWALPGGKIMVGEKGRDTIDRELKEELAISKFEVLNCNSVSEYFFTFDGLKIHQYIFSYIVNVDSDEWIMKEKDEFDGIEENENLVFQWVDLKNIGEALIKPDFLKEQLCNLSDTNTMFTSYTEEA